MQDPWIERLSEYVDEELDRSERETLEAHLTRCPACSSAVQDLKTVRERARSLTDAAVPAELWSRIESGIASGSIRSVPADPVVSGRSGGSGRARGGRSLRGGRFSFSLPELIAACLGIAILSGGAVFALVTRQAGIAPPAQTLVARAPESGAAREGAPAVEPPARPPAAEPPAQTGRETVNAERTAVTPHEEAIAEIRKALARERDRLDPATVRALESNLAIIDLAIDQAKRALLADPANTYVKEHLAETMRRKVELLQRATMLASTSNPEGNR